MMRIFTKCIVILLSAALLTAVLPTAGPQENIGPYTIDEPYDFPIKTGTDEWKSFQSLSEKLAVTQVPEEILYAMTTEALWQTFLDYPLRGNILAYNTVDQGIIAVSKQFNGLEELLRREDYLRVAMRVFNELPVLDDSKDPESYSDEELKEGFKSLLLGELLQAEISKIAHYSLALAMSDDGDRVPGLVPAGIVQMLAEKFMF